MSRIGWLLSHPEFRKHPVRVSSGVVWWEIHKLLSRNMALELDGLKLTARPIDGNGRLICYFGTKFDTIFDFLKTYLKQGMVFADVGANIGSHAINAARLVGDTGSVFAFEADPDTYRLLARNIQLNGLRNIELRQTLHLRSRRHAVVLQAQGQRQKLDRRPGREAFRHASFRHSGQSHSGQHEDRCSESRCGGRGAQRPQRGDGSLHR